MPGSPTEGWRDSLIDETRACSASRGFYSLYLLKEFSHGVTS